MSTDNDKTLQICCINIDRKRVSVMGLYDTAFRIGTSIKYMFGKILTSGLRERLRGCVSMGTIISLLTWATDSCGIPGRAVMAAITLSALRDRPVAWVRTISSLRTASQVKSSSYRAVKACRSGKKTFSYIAE